MFLGLICFILLQNMILEIKILILKYLMPSSKHIVLSLPIPTLYMHISTTVQSPYEAQCHNIAQAVCSMHFDMNGHTCIRPSLITDTPPALTSRLLL